MHERLPTQRRLQVTVFFFVFGLCYNYYSGQKVNHKSNLTIDDKTCTDVRQRYNVGDWRLRYTPSGCIGKVVADGCKVARSNPGCGWAAPIYTTHEGLRRYCPGGWGCNQSIGSSVSDAIVSSWLWSTATRSSPLQKLLQVVLPLYLGSLKKARQVWLLLLTKVLLLLLF